MKQLKHREIVKINGHTYRLECPVGRHPTFTRVWRKAKFFQIQALGKSAEVEVDE